MSAGRTKLLIHSCIHYVAAQECIVVVLMTVILVWFLSWLYVLLICYIFLALQILFFYYHRYASRCLLIEFKNPSLTVTVSQHICLVELWEKSSSFAGYCIELGERFFHEDITAYIAQILTLSIYYLASYWIHCIQYPPAST